jgi:hypothetical protein
MGSTAGDQQQSNVAVGVDPRLDDDDEADEALLLNKDADDETSGAADRGRLSNWEESAGNNKGGGSGESNWGNKQEATITAGRRREEGPSLISRSDSFHLPPINGRKDEGSFVHDAGENSSVSFDKLLTSSTWTK